MSFLTPLFFVALAAIAIPVLIHLIQRERKRVVEFPSLMFLRRIPYQSVRRRRIRNWLLLAMRAAALALVVAAFARPFVRQPQLAAAATTGARELVVLLDASYSMGYSDRWERARSAARDALNGLGAGDRASVVLFSSDPQVALRSTGDRDRLVAAIDTAQPSAGSTRYGPALKLAGSILSESPLPRRDAVLISDFQASGWKGAEGVRLPDGATLKTVSVGAARSSDAPNLAVTPVALQRSTFSNQERVAVTAGVMNRGNRPVQNLDVTLEVGGRSVQTERVQVDPNGSASVTFAPLTVDARNMRATVRLGADPLSRDNAFHFVVSPPEPVRVVVLQRTGDRTPANLYLTRALAIGDTPRFDVVVKSVDGFAGQDLQGASVTVLNDVQVVPAMASALASFVQRGGGLFVVLGERAGWPAGGPDILPGVPAGFIDRSTGDAGRLGALEYGHPVFELFRAPRSGDFSTARFYGYRAITDLKPSPAAGGPPAGEPHTGAQILARFDDGAPALIERRVGNGRVLVWTSTVDLFWNDLALKPVFLPFVHRVARHLAAYTESKPWFTVGAAFEPSGASSAGVPPARVALTPSGQRIAFDGEGPDVLNLTEQGFYEIRQRERDPQPFAVVASNVDLSESDLTEMDPREIVSAATGAAGGARAGRMGMPLTPEAQERAQGIWWYLLFAGILLLGSETLLSGRLSRNTSGAAL